MSYNNTKLVAGLLGYALLACGISGCSFDSVSYSPSKEYSSVVISCEELEKGATYTLTTGSESEKITMSSLVYSEGQSMQGPGQGGPRMDGQNGQP